MNKKLLFAIAGALASTFTFAQTSVMQIIIASGGVYEFSAPYADRATVAAYDPASSTYTVFDTIRVESVQAVVIDSIYAYVAAEDSIVKYNIDTYERVGIAYYPGIKSLAVSGDHLLVGRYYGTGSFFSVYDKHTLTEIFNVPQVNSTVEGMVVIGDTAYVGYNVKGTIDQFPPFGVYADTLGRIAVIDMNTQTFVRDIELDTTGAGIRKLFTNGTDIFGIANETGNVIRYNTLTAAVDAAYNLGASMGTALFENTLYAQYISSGIGAFDIGSETITDTVIVSSQYIASALDTVNNIFYTSETDYSSYGQVVMFDASGAPVDTIVTGISPEGIAVDYRDLTTGIVSMKSKNSMSVFPNPAADHLNVIFNGEGHVIYTLTDVMGRTVRRVESSAGDAISISLDGMHAGVYLLEAVTAEGRTVTRVVRR